MVMTTVPPERAMAMSKWGASPGAKMSGWTCCSSTARSCRASRCGRSWHPTPSPGALRPLSAGFWDTGHGYPAVRFDAGGDPVPGVMVTLDPDRAPAALAMLDEVEEEGALYRRVEVETTSGRAWAYEWLGPTESMSLLPSGWPPA